MDRTSKAMLGMFIITAVVMIFMFLPSMLYLKDKEADALDVIVERQVEEGTQYTAIVEAYDISNKLVIMDNGHEIDASELSKQPAIGDVLSYTKTFDYVTDTWNGMPKETGEAAYINIKIMN